MRSTPVSCFLESRKGDVFNDSKREVGLVEVFGRCPGAEERLRGLSVREEDRVT